MQILMAVVPLSNGLFWLFLNHLPELVQKEVLPYYLHFPLPWPTLLMGFIVTTLLPIGVGVYGLYCLQRLFQLYEQGQIFLAANVFWYKRLSQVLLLSFAAGLCCRSLLSVVLTLHHPPGQRMLTLSLGSDDINILVLGGILAVISWVMEAGRQLQEDIDLTV